MALYHAKHKKIKNLKVIKLKADYTEKDLSVFIDQTKLNAKSSTMKAKKHIALFDSVQF